MLLDRGLSVRQVAMGMYAVSGALALVSLLVASPSASLVGPVLVILGIGVAIGVQQLRIPEMRVLSTHVVRSLCRQRSLLACATVVQKMLTDLAQASDAHQTLKVVGRGLADSGFAAATLSVPVWFDIPSGGGGRMAGLSPRLAAKARALPPVGRRARRRAGAHERRVAALRRRAARAA